MYSRSVSKSAKHTLCICLLKCRLKVVQMVQRFPLLLELAPQTVAHSFACFHSAVAHANQGIDVAQVTEVSEV